MREFKVGDKVINQEGNEIGEVFTLDYYLKIDGYPVGVKFGRSVLSYTPEGFQTKGNGRNKIRHITKLDKVLA